MLKIFIKRVINRLLYLKSEFIWKRHINLIYKKLQVNEAILEGSATTLHVKYWQQLKRKVNPKWFFVYSYISGNSDIKYIPENIYFNIIEPKLNNRKLAAAYGDKNFYEIFYEDDKSLFPECIIRNIDGHYYNNHFKLLNMNAECLKNYLGIYNKILIKPATESGGGKKVQLFFNKNGMFINSNGICLDLPYLNKYYGKNFLIQNIIEQNTFLAMFNNTSVNTVRIFTYRSVRTDELIPLHAVLRIGKKGNYIDDQNVGGVACLIRNDCKFNDYATDIFGNKHYTYNGVNFSALEPFIIVKEMKVIAAKLAANNIHSRVMGFDFTVNSQNEIKLIEINHLWVGINFFQMNSSPVFGKYTDEVIDFCRNN